MGEGRIPFDGFETWYRVLGGPPDAPAHGLPVLALHGGPGLPHDSLEPLEGLARTGRPVVFYDQLGCGNSARPRDPDPWRVDLFLRELSVVRRELGLDRVHLLGHSWGGMLAMGHALERAGGISSLALIGATVSAETMLENRKAFFEKLPETARAAIRNHESAGTFDVPEDAPEYTEAMDLFHSRYTCRLDPWPDRLNRALSKMYVEANAAMLGPPNDPDPLLGPAAPPRGDRHTGPRRRRTARRHGRGPGAGDPRGHTELGARGLGR